MLIVFSLLAAAYIIESYAFVGEKSSLTIDNKVEVKAGDGFRLIYEEENTKQLIRAKETKTTYEVKKGLTNLGKLDITMRELDNGDVFVYQEMKYSVDEQVTVPTEIIIKGANEYDFFEIAEEVKREHNNTFGIDMTTNVRGLYEFENDGELVSSLYLSQNYVSKELNTEYENGEISHIRELKEENKEYEVEKNEKGFVIRNGMKLIPEADHSESWFLFSNDKLITKDETKESYKNETNHFFIHSTKWQVSNGNYSKLPWSIEPSAKMGYGRNLVTLQDKKALNYYINTKDRLFYDLVIASVNNLINFKGDKNLWETEYTSTWLKKSYGITAPYVDTRHNENISLFLTKAGEQLGIDEIKDGALNYADFLTEQKNIGNIIETENGYYIADYYSEGSKKTHVSLNHALGEANFLMEASVKNSNQLYMMTALEIYDAIQDDGEKWIRDNGDFWYQVNAEGEFFDTDYPVLTLEDLTYAMIILNDHSILGEFPVFEKMLLSKLNFVTANNYDIPKLTVERIINLGYGEYVEGYENVLEF